MASSSEKTEKPTPRRLEKARKEGQFPVSPEFLSSCYFAACMALLLSFTQNWTLALVETMRRGLEEAVTWDGGAATCSRSSVNG
jgi:flagellar biosynthesis protein FlhB